MAAAAAGIAAASTLRCAAADVPLSISTMGYSATRMPRPAQATMRFMHFADASHHGRFTDKIIFRHAVRIIERNERMPRPTEKD